MPDFWYKDFVCQMCGNEFSQVRVFSGAISIESRDEDLKPNYRGINALYYQPVTCPKCYLTLFEPDFEEDVIPPDKRPDVERVLRNAKKEFGSINLGEDRSVDDAIKIFSIMAAVYTVLKNRRRMAEAFLKLAWLFREKGDSRNEMVALGKALKAFEEHYREDITSEEEEPMILFYMGEINRRLGNKRDAVKWFSVLVNKYKGVSSPFVKAGRERWQDIKG